MVEYQQVCLDCKHLNRKALEEDPWHWGTCKAFPKGIPSGIWARGELHDEPVPGDGGVTHERPAA